MRVLRQKSAFLRAVSIFSKAPSACDLIWFHHSSAAQVRVVKALTKGQGSSQNKYSGDPLYKGGSRVEKRGKGKGGGPF